MGVCRSMALLHPAFKPLQRSDIGAWSTVAVGPETAGARGMPSDQSSTIPAVSLTTPFGRFNPAFEYLVDAAQRGVLFFDVMRQRGNQYRDHLAKTAPH